MTLKSKQPWKRVFFSIYTCCWGGNQFSPLLLLYKEHQHYSTTVVNAFLGVYVFGLFPVLLLAGRLSDRYGRKPLMLMGTFAGLMGSFCLSFSVLDASWIYVGRLASGISVGVAMAVGSSWVRELSSSVNNTAVDETVGARRASSAFLSGSMLGALVAGLIAQFTPWGEFLPFIIHLLFTGVALLMLCSTPETKLSRGTPSSFDKQFVVPSATHRRFTKVVLVAAPWTFLAAGISYGYLPLLLSASSGKWGLAYATVLTAVTLWSASLVQPIAKKLDTPDSGRGLTLGLSVIATGLFITYVSVHFGSLLIGLLTSVILGAGMGISLLSGLLEIQRIANPRDLTGLTGIFYCFAYAGFLAPFLMAPFARFVSIDVILLSVAALTVVASMYMLIQYRKYLPGSVISKVLSQ
jgi:MFS family permease